MRQMLRQAMDYMRQAQRSLLIFILSLSLAVATLSQADIANKYRQLAEKIGLKYGDRAERRIIAWRRVIDDAQGKPVIDKLKAVNNFFNMLEFVDDETHWGKKDYWATPIEFLETGGGDCEDFTIAKYFALRELGVPDEKLRLVYVKALSLNQHHMVLAYYHKPTSVPVILDNLDKVIKPAIKRKDLLPIYSFNAENLWLAKEKGRGELVGGSSRLSMWTDLNKRLTDLEG